MNMKKLNIIAMALALLVALTQCKKDEQPTPSNENNAVAITLDIKGNGGTRMDVNTGTGEVTYEEGDVIYVASGGKFIGTLTHNGTNFGGTITNPTVGEPLHFYFLGNVTPAETLTAGTTESCSVVISDQTEHLPVIEYAPSNETYAPSMTTYTSHLLNKCALVKFNVNTSSEAATCIVGMNNKVTVDFSENTLTPSKEGSGLITLPAGSGEKWAILLPQEALGIGGTWSAYSADEQYTGVRGAVPVVCENGYLTVGIDVTVTTVASTIPIGAIHGLFSINGNGTQVWFSQGNLQYIGSAATPYWKFADYQWDYFGTTTGQDSGDQNVDRDLFGWGTGDNPTNLGYPSAFHDWGCNAIANGGNQENQWHTMTREEWNYVFEGRSTESGIRWASGTVNSIKGVILLPDNWIPSIYTLNDVNNSTVNFDSNIISATDWIDMLEANGAVFLPAAGSRFGTSVSYIGSAGYYWTSSKSSSSSSNSAFDMFFNAGRLSFSLIRPDYGCSVRLVRNAE